MGQWGELQVCDKAEVGWKRIWWGISEFYGCGWCVCQWSSAWVSLKNAHEDPGGERRSSFHHMQLGAPNPTPDVPVTKHVLPHLFFPCTSSIITGVFRNRLSFFCPSPLQRGSCQWGLLRLAPAASRSLCFKGQWLIRHNDFYFAPAMCHCFDAVIGSTQGRIPDK